MLFLLVSSPSAGCGLAPLIGYLVGYTSNLQGVFSVAVHHCHS